MTPAAAHGDELHASINVTPLVDVLLVLLVIFMVMTPLLKRDLPIDLPAAAHDERSASVPDKLTLTATADGRLLVNDTPVPEEHLADVIGGRQVVFLAADRELPYARVVDLIDACRAAGVERIGVVTRPGGRVS
jgi:biopolymer transport protein ExbD